MASVLLLANQVFVVLPTVQAATNDVRLAVSSARTESRALDGAGVTQGDPITAYKWMINLDNTGTTEQRTPGDGCSPEDPDYPGTCHWASISGLRSSSPVMAQGDEGDLSDTVPISDFPNGRYLISVLADGFKLDGIHFSVPLSGSGVIGLELQPLPLLNATIKAQVFADTDSTNGQYDPGENGLAGFAGKIADTLGQVSTDVYGNPLCTTYVTDGSGQIVLDGDLMPTVQTIGSKCLSDAEGVLTIPNLGPNRYALSLVPPTGSSWIQTTTLEGNHDWDAWVMEGATGLDTEFVVAGEPFPATIFGYVPGPTSAYWSDPNHKFVAGGDGTIKGVVDAVNIYVPTTGGLSLPGDCCGGMTGAKVAHQIDKPWIVLSDLNRGDTAVWVGRGDSTGAFTIPNVPDGTYTLTYWDEPQDYILELLSVTVNGGETVDMGILPMAGWFTTIEGHIFNDTNRNGRKDPGEAGVPNFGLTLRTRGNSLMDRGSTAATTDQSGHYFFESAYPLTEWVVLEAYDDRYYTTGVTYQADNQDQPTTVLGQGVDVSLLPIIGLGGRMDWGVHAYDPTGANGVDPRNGGIVGSISYDTTRNELDPQYAAAEDWQPGVSDQTVELYATVPCPDDASVACDASGTHALAADGSYARGNLLNTYLSETWQRPTDCTARDVNGDELTYPDKQQVLPPSSGGYDCLEGPLMGVQFGTYPDAQGTPDANFGAAVDGNYGFGDGCFNGTLVATDPSAPECDGGSFESLPADDYLVHVVSTEDISGAPIYKFTREEDINIGNGDSFVPQVPPPACAGSLHQVDVATIGTDGYLATTVVDPSANGTATVAVPASEATDNPTFVDIGGSPYEGQPKPLCDTKLVTLQNGKSVVPMFNVFTDVPLPGRFFAYVVDDLNFSSDPKSLMYGEKAGIPFVPVGIYDFANRLVTTVESDYNGLFDVLLPSTNRINCPTPSGVCTNLYRFVGNDPGIPGRLNLNYNPHFRTIAAEFEAMPGVIVPADNAPTQVGVTIQLPGSQQTQTVSCALNLAGVTPTTPELFTVSKPYADVRTATSDAFTIKGRGFGSAGTVALDGVALPTTSWSDTDIAVDVPGSTAAGPHQLKITRTDNGYSTVNGLTFTVLTADAVVPGAFPTNGTPIDTFNRADNASIANSWNVILTNSGSGTTATVVALGISSNQARVSALRTGNASASATRSTTFAIDQEAYFTFTKPGPNPTEQGLLLKSSTSDPNNTANGRWIQVTYDQANSRVLVRTKTAGQTLATVNAATPVGSFTGVTFAAGDKLGARALRDGRIQVLKQPVSGSWTVIGTASAPAFAALTGRIGVRFVGPNFSATNDALFDNFGGGNASVTLVPGYHPNLYLVGPGKTYDPGLVDLNAPSHAIQRALDAAAASAGDDLVVVFPATPQGGRINPRGAYYENLIISTPVKLQGVGPGGVYPNGTPVTGSIVDGSAFGGDTAIADAWRTRMDSLTWVGQQASFEGPVLTLLATSTSAYGQTYKAAVDGFDIRGGDQSDFPTLVGGGETGLAESVVTQGGGVFVNAYAHYLQITNNVIEANSGSYAGGIRVGTPDLASPDTNQHNDHVRIANNRILANAGTNLAGGIGLFAGSDNYEIASNDICANFSSEYGGGISAYGLSPNGSIHDNRIYFNSSYDEGGGIMIAGQLPVDPTILSPGSGPVDIARNVVQANLANDDGGGIRFLMAGNFPMNVVNNVIANNISTHEGGGIAIDDAPNVRIINDTIAKNITTATAVTSTGQKAPAGVSTGANSALLQATLPAGSPTFSKPLIFNDIFWDNRAGSQASGTVTGIGIAGDASPIVHWDVGTADASGEPAPTNSMLHVSDGTVVSGTNQYGVNPTFISEYDTSVAFQPWRGSPLLVGAIMVATDVPPTLMGNYHIPTSSPAMDAPNSASSAGSIAAPGVDIDGVPRPTGARFDLGADELPGTVVVAFPRTSLLDSFTRSDGGLGGNWDGDTSPTIYRIQGNLVQVRADGTVWWKAGSTPGANQEAFLTLTKLGASASQQGLLLKLKSPGLAKASFIKVVVTPGGNVEVWTKAPRNVPILQTTFAAAFVANDKLGVRTQSDGSVSVFRNGIQVGSTNVTTGTNPWAASLVGAGGRIGVVYVGATNADDATFDDFGGGTLP